MTLQKHDWSVSVTTLIMKSQNNINMLTSDGAPQIASPRSLWQTSMWGHTTSPRPVIMEHIICTSLCCIYSNTSVSSLTATHTSNWTLQGQTTPVSLRDTALCKCWGKSVRCHCCACVWPSTVGHLSETGERDAMFHLRTPSGRKGGKTQHIRKEMWALLPSANVCL